MVMFDREGNLYVDGKKKSKGAKSYPRTLEKAIARAEWEGRGYRAWMGQHRDYLTCDLPDISFRCRHTGHCYLTYGSEAFWESAYQLEVEDNRTGLTVLRIGETWLVRKNNEEANDGN